jgi:uncharacterized protein YdhG (YjbR/CyaY superfamily)
VQYPEPMTVDQYIAAAPEHAQPILRTLRQMARERCPDAEETINYKMPAFRVGRVFLYFAAFKHHIGVYPPVEEPAALVEALKPYRGPKGNLQFPYDKAMPFDLIGEVIDALYAAYAVKT